MTAIYDFAVSVAANIPGAVADHQFDNDGNKLDNRAKVNLRGGGAVLLITDYRGQGTALVHIGTRDLDSGSAPDMPRCGFNPSADPSRVAGNIKRKLLPSVPELIERVESIRTAQAARRDRVSNAADEMAARFPGMTIRKGEHEATFWNNSPAFGGTIKACGGIYLKHLSVDADKAQAVIAALMGV